MQATLARTPPPRTRHPAAVAAAAIGLRCLALFAGIGAGAEPADIPFLTPAGITIGALGDARESDGIVHLERGGRLRGEAFTDARGMTLYTYDKDVVPGTSACTGECRSTWPASVAAAGADAGGDWTAFDRHDGGRQWAYQGKPVYTFSGDTEPGHSLGDGVDGLWHVVRLKRPESDAVPFGISVAAVPDAGGNALVDHKGMTLYVYSGKTGQDSSRCRNPMCENQWIPVPAPAVAAPVGEFSPVSRPDGTAQWAYKSLPLYRFSGDAQIGDATGTHADERWQPAVVTKFPAPPGVRIVPTRVDGTVFATAEGKTLYRYNLLSRTINDGAHSAPYIPGLARALGTMPCSGKCLELWQPLLAAPGDQPSGYWSIVPRDDGTRQWAYRHYPVYTYAGDRRAGDTFGNNTVVLQTNDPDLKTVSMLTRARVDTGTVSGFYWTTSFPK